MSRTVPPTSPRPAFCASWARISPSRTTRPTEPISTPTAAALIRRKFSALNFLRMSAAAVGVDIGSVGRVVRDGDIRAQLAQNAGRGFVGGTVRDIDRDPHFFQSHSARKTLLGKFDITAKSVVNSGGAADFASGRADRIDLAAENELLNLLLDLIIELIAVMAEKFNAVVGVRIMRSGENDPGIGAQ